MNTLKTHFPITINSSLLDSACDLKIFRNNIQHLRLFNGKNTHLVAGAAYAKGLEVTRKAYYNDKKSQEEAVEIGILAMKDQYGDHESSHLNKTCPRIEWAIRLYFMNYPMETDTIQPALLSNGQRAIEYSFVHQLPFDHPDLKGVKLSLVGRVDMLVEFAGSLYFLDDKTTGGYAGKNWSSQWDTRGQFSCYSWGLHEAGIDVAGAYIRGCFLTPVLKRDIPMMEFDPALAYSGCTKFQDTQTTRTAFDRKLWYSAMIAKVERLLKSYEEFKAEGGTEHAGLFFMGDWGTACNTYGSPCLFTESCRNERAERYLSSQFEQVVWLPQEQRTVSLTEHLTHLEELNAKD